ncbi:MAG: alpha/beta fold hydrolase [Alphaproteobacteria bacterium]|nr:MAG: alpha/beta fold hydrolase [Alphaproteobacteria bacterium]
MLKKLNRQIQCGYVITDSHFENLIQCGDDNLALTSTFNDPCVVVFSSGTTSAPKGIALSFKNLYFSALGFSQFFSQKAHDISLINLPHHHVGGLMILWRAFFTGGKVVSDLSGPIDFISLVPLQLKRMLEDQSKLDILKKIKVILIGGAALAPSLKKEAEKRGLSLYETYGMSETTSLVMINGEVLPYRQLRLDDSNLFNVKGETLAVGYFENQTLMPFTQEWFKTNDVGLMTNNGRYQFKERADLVFICGGENINPLIVEEVAKDHPGITDAYLIPIPDEEWGEIGVLLYEPTDISRTSNEQLNIELKKNLKNSIHPHLIPKFFFPTILRFEGQLKPKRSELKKIAMNLYLKSIFSCKHIEHSTKNAPLLVLFHGFMGDKFDLIDCLTPLQSKYSILSIDLPGHGDTRIENFHSLQDVLQKLANFIKIFSPTPTYYGYSMGGRVALLLALNHLPPEQLLLESTGLGLNDENEKLIRLNTDQSLLNNVEQLGIKEFLKNWYTNPMFKTYSTMARFEKDCDIKSFHDFKQWKKSQTYLSVGAFPTLASTVDQIIKSHLPITYIYGEDDQKYKSMAITLSDLNLQNIQTIQVLGAGHNPHKTHPAEIAAIATNMLKYFPLMADKSL